MGQPRIEPSRFWGWLMQLADLTEAARPWTRRAFSPQHAEGRRWLATQMRALGLTVFVDAAGNLIGRQEGTAPHMGTLMVGSHSDTVAGGGRFDGIAGVITGLEIAAALQQSGTRLRHCLEIVDFLAEEPNDFGISCVGSRGMAGALDDEMLARTNSTGASLRESLRDVGAGAEPLVSAARRDIAAFFELHIEQGPVLEAAAREVGIVTHIVGIRRLAVTFKGQAAHAGTTPMDLRQDALVAGARFLVDLRRHIDEARGQPDFVIATVGELHVAPNAPNVIAGEARLTVDLRSDQTTALDTWTERIRGLAECAAAGFRTRLAEYRVLSTSPPTACAPALSGALRDTADKLGLLQQDIVSGAGHDAAFMARIAPAAMLFIPSRGGLSHCADEWSDPDALGKGIATLLGAIRRIDSTQ